MEPLVKLRNLHKGRLTKMQTTVNKHDVNPLNLTSVTSLLESLIDLDAKVLEIQEKISAHCTTDAEIEDQVDVAEWFHTKVTEVKDKLYQIKLSITPASTAASVQASVKLPACDLPKFDGCFDKWQSFQDLFIATVDNNKTLSGAQKLQYLKSCLKDNALQLIQSFTVTDQNYNEAWKILTDRYDNKREIVNSIIKRLHNQPNLKSESAVSLQKLLDVTTECLRSLKVIGRPVDHWDDMIVYLVVEKMDPESRREWAMTLKSMEPPTFKNLSDFLENHIRGLQAGGQQQRSANNQSNGERRHTSSHHTAAEEVCVVCQSNHAIYQCAQFKAMSVPDRVQSVRSSSICFNCLRSGHAVRQCKSNSTCKKCKKQHHTLLHLDSTNQQQVVATVESNFAESKQNLQVLLKTALVKVKDQSGVEHICRVFLDSGSQASFMTEACANALGVIGRRTCVQVSGVSLSKAGTARREATCTLYSLVHDASVEVDVLIMPKVTGPLPTYPCNSTNWEHLVGLELADPDFHKPGPIDILLGNDVSESIITEGRKVGRKYTAIAQNTIFGWVLSGRVSSHNQPTVQVHYADCQTDNILRRFWELEELPTQKFLTPEEITCENHFVQTHTRDNEGRYIVKLPFNAKVKELGESRDQAFSRLKQLERRFARDPTYKDAYVKFMRQYEDLHHMEPVPVNDLNKQAAFYLPHHYVLKEDSSTTKFRVVFDGSAKSSSGVSLNNALMVGPTIQDDLFTLLLRFRCHKIALKGDIEKMYRQFKVNSEDSDYQRILWREDPAKPVQEYRLSTVTYGTASAPFLATRCLKQLAKDEATNFPEAAKALDKDMYVDDLMSGESTPERAIQLFNQLRTTVKNGGMDIRKWATNDPTVLESIPPELRESNQSLSFDNDKTVKALGVRWNPVTDCFYFVVNSQPIIDITKRKLLSENAKVFDPLGWLSPVTIRSKILFQDLWRDKMEWDDKVAGEQHQQYTLYQSKLHAIESISIPRCIILPNAIRQILHGFSDASEKAYSAAVYLLSEDASGTTTIHLITAKTKVSPIKQVSLPRLELCGAVLLAKLIKHVKKSINFPCSVTAWTDSTIVLDWLASFPGRWHTFVANRVAEIQGHEEINEWRYVPGECNPADCASRGINPDELKDFNLWWNGPEWLKQQPLPTFKFDIDRSGVTSEEKKRSIVVAHIELSSVEPTLLSKYSSLSKLNRVTAYCLRFVHNLKLKKDKSKRVIGSLSCEEIQSAQIHSILQMQSEAFGSEIKNLTIHGHVSHTSKLKQLFPYIDNIGVLRVGGRLQNSTIPEERKHQIILPHYHHVTQLIIKSYHLSHLHGGFQLINAALQQQYWILKARDVIRHFIRKCVICRKRKAALAQQLMGSLPSPRVNPGRPFQSVGVDYAGPFMFRPVKGRGNKLFKCYFAVFVCLATKAVHLEAASELTTEAFIAVLKRFVARRGLCSHIYSDCGTNFVGAEKELQILKSQSHNDTVSNHLAEKGIVWHFNPPAAPHQGGLWEAGVKSVKFHLRRVVGNVILTLEEFQTVLCQVEACLNSRPLCAMSTDPTDFVALTPGHFLIGCPLTAVPEPDLTTIKCNRLSRWQYTQQLVQHFWRRWSAEYLTTLQQRFKWNSKRDNLNQGDLVIIKDDNLPPMKWKLGRIVETHPGADFCVRVVTVKTATGELKRPIAKLCPILFNDE